MVDLFASLRTVHVAAEGTSANFMLSNAAEKCAFASKVALKNNIKDIIHTNVQPVDETWAKAFVADALRLGARVIMIIGGFPCKGLSHARGAAREHLENKDSILFWELTRILELVTRAAGSAIAVKHIVETVMMDKEPENIVSQHFGDRATKTPASPACAAGRDCLFWFDFELTAFDEEILDTGTVRNELTLEVNPERTDFWDEGWGPADTFNGTMPTLQRWRTWDQQPPDPRGIYIRSKEAIERLKSENKRSSAITFYEEKNMAICESSAQQKQNGFWAFPKIGPAYRKLTPQLGKATTAGQKQWGTHSLCQSSQGY